MSQLRVLFSCVVVFTIMAIRAIAALVALFFQVSDTKSVHAMQRLSQIRHSTMSLYDVTHG